MIRKAESVLDLHLRYFRNECFPGHVEEVKRFEEEKFQTEGVSEGLCSFGNILR